MLLLVLGVLLFGRNLPQLGRSLGKTVTEFKRGVKGLEDDIEPTAGGAPRTVEPEPVRPPQRVTSSGAEVRGRAAEVLKRVGRRIMRRPLSADPEPA